MQKFSFDDLRDRVCVITGGAGILGTAMIRTLATAGVKVAILDLDGEKAGKLAKEISKESGTMLIGVRANVLDKSSLEEAKNVIHHKLGKIEILINAAGGNSPGATTTLEQILPEQMDHPEDSFFGLQMEAFDRV
ncbi:MAG: SDR family NAD(P)-dependent oxidoreductase, partial [Bacteroidales bacterium]|nr:SDR family NAD(P)-dependent oxidoreductase [Bacteroidales bacterium]